MKIKGHSLLLTKQCENCGELISELDNFCRKCSASKEYRFEDLESLAKDELYMQILDKSLWDSNNSTVGERLMFEEPDAIGKIHGPGYIFHDAADVDHALDIFTNLLMNVVQDHKSHWYVFLFEGRVPKGKKGTCGYDHCSEALFQFLRQNQSDYAGETEDTEAIVVIYAGVRNGPTVTRFAYKNAILQNFGPSNDEDLMIELPNSTFRTPWAGKINHEPGSGELLNFW